MDRNENRKNRFGSGVLTGVLATLCVLGAGRIGYLAAEGTPVSWFLAETLEEKGAKALTDASTRDKLREVAHLIDQEYLNEADGQLLTDMMMKGIAVGLDDPYASYYTAEELQSVLDAGKGAYFGIGVTLSQDQTTGVVSVAQVYEGSPADQAGIQEADVVKVVDGVSVEGMMLSDLVTLIKGKEGDFQMTLRRPQTEEELEVTLFCEQVEMYHMNYRMLDEQIGYMELLEFTESAVGQMEDALLDLKGQGMQKLIIDLRGNPGGLLEAVCDIADYFLDEERIVYMENKNGSREEYYAKDGRIVDCELAVLVNGYTASASEIFAGLVQDYDLGIVVGEQTYGKGVVQVTYSLKDGSAFKMTVQEYFTAKGQEIDGVGITPDIIIEETADAEADAGDPVLQAAVAALQSGSDAQLTGGTDGE